MKFITVTELQAQLSSIVSKVGQGEEYTVTKNGHPVAVLAEHVEAHRKRTEAKNGKKK